MSTYEGDRLELELEDIHEIDVRGVGGEISITAGARATARLEVEVLRGPAAQVAARDGVLLVEHQPGSGLGWWLNGDLSVRANVTLVVPENTVVRARAVNGDVFVGGLRTSTSLSTVSGRITATGLDGDVGLRTVSGDIDVQGVGAGVVRINVVSGDVTISGGAPEEVSVRSVSGEVALDFDDVPDVDCTTVSGDVAVRLPFGAGLDLDAITLSGRLESGFPDALDTGKRRLRGRIGDGGRRLSVRTTSGDVTVLRRATIGADA